MDAFMLVFAIVALVAGGWVWRRWKTGNSDNE
jgi:hypothetical protein